MNGKGLIVLLFFVVAVMGCNYAPIGSKTEEKEIKNAIMRYNQLLIKGYKKMDMNVLREVATREHIEKVYLHMAALGEEGKRLEASQKKLVFEKINLIDKKNAEVVTTEIWDYRHIDILKDTVVREERNVVYKLKYRLIKLTYHGWVVQDIKALNQQG